MAAGQAASLSPVGGGVPRRGPAIGAAACGAVRAADGLRTSPARPGRTPIPTDFNENGPTAPVRTMRNPNRTRPIPASP